VDEAPFAFTDPGREVALVNPFDPAHDNGTLLINGFGVIREQELPRFRCRVQCVGEVWAYVFVDTENPGPKRVVREIRKLDGVVRADALFGTPDIVVLVEGDDIAAMDSVIDQIAELPGVLDTDSKIARWID
jgi:DNA-binding Lrp family transcriptional regulator